jgi:chromosome segregation protein
MQLSKLEIKGFKSFGDKVVVNFDDGITGIVGPNGCGKSNIVDAIRWVLGEQKTRALRSEKMENIIFNGTKTRKPLQMAEVSLSFNNTRNLLPTEYSQVTITRRYYRSGESEYLLNGVSCRLKDINDLFLDTGIGSDSYAIIELKMVDDILNDKENSRRNLFEEAAGISKFKKRKKESLRKLEETDKDLERVNDLLFEINGNLKSLEKQARQAKRYFDLKEEYKNESVKLARVSLKKQTDGFIEIQKEIELQTTNKVRLSAQLQEKESEVEKKKADLLTREKTLSSRQKSLNEHVGKIRQYESEKKIKNERLRFLNDKKEGIQQQLDLDKKSLDRADFSIKILEKELESAEKLLNEQEICLGNLKQEYEEQKRRNAALQEEATVLNNNQKRQQEKVYNLNKQLEINNIQLSSLKQELEKTSTDDNENNARIAEFDSKLKEINDLVSVKNMELEKLQNSDDHLLEQIDQTEKEIDTIKEQLIQLNRKLDARQNEYNLTKSMVENLEGFPEAIKFLRKNSSWGKDTPLLSDILTCDESFRLSIENYLESFMNYYVVDDQEHAFQAVNLLSNSAKGKANFFIQNAFSNFKPAVKQEFPNAVCALDIVEYDPKYQKLIEFILDKVYILTNKQDDIPTNNEYIFITQNGKITKRQFSITGGSVGLFEGKRIGRVKNLEKLEKEIKTLNSDLDTVKRSLEKKQKLLLNFKEGLKRDQIENLKKEINLVSQDLISLQTKQEQYSKFLDSNASHKENILDKIEKLQQEIEENGPKLKEDKNLLEDMENRFLDINDALIQQNELYNQKSAAYNQENIQFHQHQNKLNSLSQEISFKTQSLEQSKERIGKNYEDLQKTDEEIKGLLGKSEIQDDELVEMYQEQEGIEQGLNEVEKEYYAIRGSIEENEKLAREVRKSKENNDQMLAELQGKLNESKLSLNSIKDRLSVEFSINLDEIEHGEESEEPTEPEPELKQRVNSIKDKIDKIGPINPMAMEAYEEIQERHKFIEDQKEDLAKAKSSLLDTIKEIDTVAKETFMDAYDKIRTNFQLVFRSLFTEEDTCDLNLTDPNNPLDSTIEIMAKPKGKRPLTINQLSGGEKTLTAISLLFAIYLIKPAPFCIFDEVDAPLDDANIDKFNNIIRKFAKESQFIIVTHNKRTMSSTDIIYGVTMIEQGVSRLVPVDLRSLV